MRLALAIACLIALPAAANPTSQVARLSWMLGTWSETKGGVVTKETWQARDGALVGVGETTRPGKAARTERMKITAEAAGATYTALIPGQAPTPFVLVEPSAEGQAVFENKAHDFPQRVIYRKCGPQLCARIEGTIGGQLKFQEWTYTRVK